MSIFSKALIGSAGLAMSLAAAAPAAAQYYPQPQPYNNGGGIVGAIINSVTGGGYGQYSQGNYGYNQVSQRTVVAQCAAAAEQRLNGGYSNQGYNPYQNGYGQNGYAQNGYGYQQNGGARVVGITNVERRSNGGLRVHGVATTGAYANQGYNRGYAQQGYAAQQADVRFNCKVNSRGQITDVNVNRIQPAYRGY
jgi:hypothetical protein